MADMALTLLETRFGMVAQPVLGRLLLLLIERLGKRHGRTRQTKGFDLDFAAPGLPAGPGASRALLRRETRPMARRLSSGPDLASFNP